MAAPTEPKRRLHVPPRNSHPAVAAGESLTSAPWQWAASILQVFYCRALLEQLPALENGLHFVINAHLSFFSSFRFAQSIFMLFLTVVGCWRAERHDFTFLAGAFVRLLIEETLKVKFCLPHCYNPEKHECTAVFCFWLSDPPLANRASFCQRWSFFNEVSAAICWVWLFDMQLVSFFSCHHCNWKPLKRRSHKNGQGGASSAQLTGYKLAPPPYQPKEQEPRMSESRARIVWGTLIIFCIQWNLRSNGNKTLKKGKFRASGLKFIYKYKRRSAKYLDLLRCKINYALNGYR